MKRITSSPDPFILNDSITNANGLLVNRQTLGLTPRPQAFNSALRNLVLIGAGQSNYTTLIPTLYVPTNTAAIDNFNIYDGNSYPISGPLLGTEWDHSGGAPSGNGNVLARLVDKLIAGGNWDRIILVPIAVGGTTAADWAVGNLADRFPCAMRRLASRGYVVGATGLTFAITWGQGENDKTNGTTQIAYTAAMNTIMTNLLDAGFVGRFYVNQQTWISGTTSSAVAAAQAALPNGTTFFAGGNLDSLNASNRQSDNTHFNDTGADAAATLIYNAVHASGAPF